MVYYCIKQPDFAVESELAALRWISLGHGYEITGGDVLDAYAVVMKAVPGARGSAQQVNDRIRSIVSGSEPRKKFVRTILGHHLSN